MTPADMFDGAFASAMQDRRDLLQFLHGVGTEQARWRPPDGEWSILEGLEHVTLSEEFFRARLLQVLHDAEASGTWDNAPAHPVKMSAAALRRREQGFVPAPAELEPSGQRRLRRSAAGLTPGATSHPRGAAALSPAGSQSTAVPASALWRA